MTLTHRAISALAITVAPACDPSPDKLLADGVAYLGFTPTAQAHIAPLGSLVAHPKDKPEDMTLLCGVPDDFKMADSEPCGQFALSGRTVFPGLQHRIQLTGLCSRLIDDTEELWLSRRWPKSCLQVVAARQKAGFEVRIVRGELVGSALNNDQVYRPMGRLGVQLEAPLFPLEGADSASRVAEASGEGALVPGTRPGVGFGP